MRRVASLALCTCLALAADQAQARPSTAYFSLNPGFQWYDTTELIIDKHPESVASQLVPQSGFQPELRLGFNVGGYGGLEGFVGGHWWTTQASERYGGGGVAGGLVRITPLEVFQYLWAPMAFRPIDVGLSFGAGYTIVGQSFAYQGWFLQYGFDLTAYIFPFLSVGFELPVRQMMYLPMRYTHLGQRKGLCTQGGAAFGNFNGDTREVDRTAIREETTLDGKNTGVVTIDSNSGRVVTNYILGERSDSDVNACSGPAPEAWQYTPMLKVTLQVEITDLDKVYSWIARR